MKTTSLSRTITASLALSLSLPSPSNRNRFHNTIILTQAYRIGDAVGILLKTTSSHRPRPFGNTPPSTSTTSTALEPYRHQMPRFGVSTKTRFDIASLLGGRDPAASNDDLKSLRRLRLSLSFDDGFHHIPWLDVYYHSSGREDHEKMLDKLIVTFVYSAGDGTIHAVHRQAEYLSLPSSSSSSSDTVSGRDHRQDADESHMLRSFFTMEYQWVEEADVDLQGGIFTLFLGVLMVILSGMWTGERRGDGRDGDEATMTSDGSDYYWRRKSRLKNKQSSLEEGGGDDNNYASVIGSDDRAMSADGGPSSSFTSTITKRL